MKKLIDFMNSKFAPVLTKITKNVWISSIQDTMMSVLPMIFVGSLITMISLLSNIIPNFPNLSPINSFSFGLLSLFVAFLIPYNVMGKKDKAKMKITSGIASIALFLMLLNPTFTEDGGITFVFERFGSAGMFVAIVVGIFTGIIMNIFANLSLFKKDSTIPDFVKAWFDSMIPITIVLLTGWLFNYALHIDLFTMIINIFMPLAKIGNTLPGFVLFYFITVFIYSFGISGWTLVPIVFPIWLQGIADNAALVAQGKAPVFINTYEVIYTGWIAVGGIGSTLILVILMVLSKSKRLKAIGKAVLIPSIFNINEPVVYGAPIAWNPILMIPFWLNGLIIPTITYIVLNMGLVPIPSQVFQLWYLPFPIPTYIVAGIKGVILLAFLVLIMFLIWYPFFKVYEAQEIKKENEETQEYDDLELELD
ncbi:PTS sugar transporter subunit IIC [Abyssisolibacter fermentans]|uniref:PTS sugar transporter subunit IIC n=1 Tax=Abyssisolibacter fermentans TaxID=1766203 RepID=UPI000837944A|nr:PTS transporter subunit EIIC [Abyssisolibacter fermentans]